MQCRPRDGRDLDLARHSVIATTKGGPPDPHHDPKHRTHAACSWATILDIAAPVRCSWSIVASSVPSLSELGERGAVRSLWRARPPQPKVHAFYGGFGLDGPDRAMGVFR